ncbi:hypothetical protein [Shimia abyssi]|uniref:Uncharacterized protein n=1 Tax=Shimia abyssi TaxID=1662395 RepID=A0A2P8FET6_9RHOB|nr:hypothetical protein [Shimia abyssi]PSL20204.1 hypothetical protein CLV88_104265 [Shimia abyssi]
MRTALILAALTAIAACEGPSNHSRAPEPEPTTGVTISGEARTGVVLRR